MSSSQSDFEDDDVDALSSSGDERVSRSSSRRGARVGSRRRHATSGGKKHRGDEDEDGAKRKHHKKGKSKRKKKSRRGGGHGGDRASSLLGLVVLAAVLYWLVFSGGNPDAILGTAMPRPVSLTTLPPNAWKREGPRMSGRLQSARTGVVQPQLNRATFAMEDVEPLGAPTAHAGTNSVVFAGVRDGYPQLFSFDATSGERLWSIYLDRRAARETWLRVGEPLGLEELELVVFPASCRTIDAFRARDGYKMWSVALPAEADACGTTELFAQDGIDGNIVALTTDGYLLAIRPDYGTLAAPVRSLACARTSGTEPCLLSRAVWDGTGSLYFKARASDAMARQAKGRGWFIGPSGARLEALYVAELVESDADLDEMRMFRVAGTRVLGPVLRTAPGAALEASVAIAPGARSVLVTDAGMLRQFDSRSLEPGWVLYLCRSCQLRSVVASDDWDAFVASDDSLFRLEFNPELEPHAEPRWAWQFDFAAAFTGMVATEDTAALSAPLPMENGVLMRVGTRRGSARAVAQAALVLIDRATGTLRSTAGQAVLSTGPLEVDRLGAVYSTADAAMCAEARAVFGEETVSAWTKGGVQVLRALGAGEAAREAARALRDRATALEADTTSGWFGGSNFDKVAALGDLLHLRETIQQAQALADAAQPGSWAATGLRRAARDLFEGKLEEDLLAHAKYVASKVSAAAQAAL